MNTFLVGIFAELANDPTWPTGGVYWAHKLKEARLAVMVIEEIACNLESDGYVEALQQEGIHPDHYTNVKERVEKAKGGENDKQRS